MQDLKDLKNSQMSLEELMEQYNSTVNRSPATTSAPSQTVSQEAIDSVSNLLSNKQPEQMFTPMNPSQMMSEVSENNNNMLQDGQVEEIQPVQNNELEQISQISQLPKENTLSKYEQLQERLIKLGSKSKEDLEAARKRDFYKTLISQAFNVLGTAGMARAQALSGQNIGIKPLTSSAIDTSEKQAKEDLALDKQTLQDQIAAELKREQNKIAEQRYQDQLKLKERELEIKGKDLEGKKGEGLFEKEMTKLSAKQLSDFYQTERPQMLSSLSEVNNALSLLEDPKKNVSGPSVAVQPDWLLSITNADAIKARESMNKAIQDTLRPTLGAQFTENEGKRIMNLTYNPKLGPEENARRAKELKKIIKLKIQAGEELGKHLNEGKSISSFDFDKYGMEPERKESVESSQEKSANKFTEAQERGIFKVMEKNNISRQEAINALKAAGKL